MREPVVMDTNVAVVANGKHPAAGYECEGICLATLEEIRESRRVLVDEPGWILREYLRNLSLAGQPGPGDAFFKWLWDNQSVPELCRRVAVASLDDVGRSFAEFPDDPELAGFDPSDRKFAAVVLASGEPAPILNAADTDWWHYRQALARHGIEVRFLCPELMKPKF